MSASRETLPTQTKERYRARDAGGRISSYFRVSAKIVCNGINCLTDISLLRHADVIRELERIGNAHDVAGADQMLICFSGSSAVVI